MKGRKSSNMDILAYKKTSTSQFIMPLLFENKKFTEIISEFNSFVNAYIADFDKPENDNKIILVFNSKQKALPKMNMTTHYTKTVKDEILYFYVYEIPSKLEDNYTLWLMGKYSLFSDEAKKIILNFWDAGDSTLLYGALYKKGDAIPNFWKEHLNKRVDKNWTNDEEEWWSEPALTKEIYGAE